MEATTAVVEATAASYRATMESAADHSTAAVSAAIAISATVAIPTAESVTAIAVSAAEPRPGANKEATVKPGRPVVAIGSAGIGCIAVIPPLAGGRRVISPINRPNTDAY
jgi:hypothetical protein